MELARATGSRDINLYVLAWTVVVGFFGLVALLMFVALPSGAAGYINQLFGAMAAGFGMVLSYFFGTNKSSSEKTRMLAQKTNGSSLMHIPSKKHLKFLIQQPILNLIVGPIIQII